MVQASRALWKQRFASSLVVSTLAVGIGLTTAVFAIFNGVLLAPLPFPDSDRIVAVYDVQPACSTCPASFPKYNDWKTRNDVFVAIGGATQGSYVLTGDGSPERVSGLQTTASLNDVLRVPPVLGRWFSAEEDQPGGPKVVVVGNGLWVSRYGSDPNLVGKKLQMNGDSYEVIGVMPPGFIGGQVYVPLQRKLDPSTRGNHFLVTYARLKPEVSVEQAAARMKSLGETLMKEFGHNHGIDVKSYREIIVASTRGPLRVLMAAGFFVLLIAAANIANLLLAAGLARQREVAIRMALGATQWNLARLAVVESLILATLGGGFGLALSYWLTQVFLGLAGSQLPRASTIRLDFRVALFALAGAVIVGIGCGLWPLARVRFTELITSLKDSANTGGTARLRLGHGAVIAQIALSCALLAGGGLLLKNLVALQEREAGFRSEGVVTFTVAPAGARYEAPEALSAFFHNLEDGLRGVNGVTVVGMTSHLPMQNWGMNGEMTLDGPPRWKANEAPLVEYRFILGDYLKALEIPLVKGRALGDRDGKGTRTVMINQAMADKFWPGQDPIGHRFGQGEDHARWYEVVGVVGNVRARGLANGPLFEFYQTVDQSGYAYMTVVIKTAGVEPESVVPAARQIVSSLDPLLPISGVQTMTKVVADSVGQPRLLTAVASVFALAAAILSMVGVYGVMTYNVRREKREFGIRLALGAERRQVEGLVLSRGLRLAVIGVAAGVAGGFALSRFLASLLNDVKPTDPWVFAATAAATFAVTLASSYFPARRASRLDPASVLRST